MNKYLTFNHFKFILFSTTCSYISYCLFYRRLLQYFFPRANVAPELYWFECTIRLFLNQHRILDVFSDSVEHARAALHSDTIIFDVFGLPPFIYTINIPNIQYILKDNFQNFGKTGAEMKSKMQGLLGDGIFNADGQQWFKHRKTSAHLFKLENFKTTMLDSFNEDMDTVISILFTKMKTNSAIDIHDLMHRFTMESIGRIALGCDLKCFDDDKSSNSYSYNFDYCTQQVNSSFVNPFWKFIRYFTPNGWKYFYCVWQLNRFCYKIIKERRLAIKNGTNNKSDLLSLYLNQENFQTNPAESKWMEPTDRNIRDVILNITIAGRDTTAQALSWAIFRLCIHPEQQQLIREEIKRAVSDHPHTKKSDWLSYEQLQHMQYIEALCMETLRLHPSVPKEAKGVVKADTLPDGTKLYPGDMVVFFPYLMGRSTELWGEDALEFNPDRFYNKPKPNPFIFTAFQAGPRICLGQNFALLEMKCCLARMLSQFELVLAQDIDAVRYGSSLTLPIQGGLLIKLHKHDLLCAVSSSQASSNHSFSNCCFLSCNRVQSSSCN